MSSLLIAKPWLWLRYVRMLWLLSKSYHGKTRAKFLERSSTWTLYSNGTGYCKFHKLQFNLDPISGTGLEEACLKCVEEFSRSR